MGIRDRVREQMESMKGGGQDDGATDTSPDNEPEETTERAKTMKRKLNRLRAEVQRQTASAAASSQGKPHEAASSDARKSSAERAAEAAKANPAVEASLAPTGHPEQVEQMARSGGADTVDKDVTSGSGMSGRTSRAGEGSADDSGGGTSSPESGIVDPRRVSGGAGGGGSNPSTESPAPDESSPGLVDPDLVSGPPTGGGDVSGGGSGDQQEDPSSSSDSSPDGSDDTTSGDPPDADGDPSPTPKPPGVGEATGPYADAITSLEQETGMNLTPEDWRRTGSGMSITLTDEAETEFAAMQLSESTGGEVSVSEVVRQPGGSFAIEDESVPKEFVANQYETQLKGSNVDLSADDVVYRDGQWQVRTAAMKRHAAQYYTLQLGTDIDASDLTKTEEGWTVKKSAVPEEVVANQFEEQVAQQTGAAPEFDASDVVFDDGSWRLVETAVPKETVANQLEERIEEQTGEDVTFTSDDVVFENGGWTVADSAPLGGADALPADPKDLFQWRRQQATADEDFRVRDDQVMLSREGAIELVKEIKTAKKQALKQAQKEKAQSDEDLQFSGGDLMLSFEGATELRKRRFDAVEAYETRRKQAVQQIDAQVDKQMGEDLTRGEDYRIVETDKGLQAKLTKDFAETQLETQLEENVSTNLKPGEDFKVVRKDGKFRAKFTEKGYQQYRQAQQDDTAIDKALGGVDDAAEDTLADIRAKVTGGIPDAAMAAVPVAVGEPTPIGEAVVGGLLVAAAAGNYAKTDIETPTVSAGEVTVPDSTDFRPDELSAPATGALFDSEVSVDDETGQRRREIRVPETLAIDEGDVNVPESLDRSEISVTDGEVTVPAEAQVVVTNQKQVQDEETSTEDEVVIEVPDEFIPDEEVIIGEETTEEDTQQYRNVDRTTDQTVTSEETAEDVTDAAEETTVRDQVFRTEVEVGGPETDVGAVGRERAWEWQLPTTRAESWAALAPMQMLASGQTAQPGLTVEDWGLSEGPLRGTATGTMTGLGTEFGSMPGVMNVSGLTTATATVTTGLGDVAAATTDGYGFGGAEAGLGFPSEFGFEPPSPGEQRSRRPRPRKKSRKQSEDSDELGALGEPGASDPGLAPGWFAETVTDLALGLDADPSEPVSDEQLADQPFEQQLTGQLPTAAMLSGDEQTQAQIDEALDLLGWGGR